MQQPLEPITSNFLGIISSRLVRNKDNTYYGEIHALLPKERPLTKTPNYKTRDDARVAVKEILSDTSPLD